MGREPLSYRRREAPRFHKCKQNCEAGMHIALFIHALTVGGAQNRTLAVANGLAERGHRVDLVVAVQGTPNEARLDPRIRLVPLSPRRSTTVGSGLRRITDLMSAIPALVSYLNSAAPHVLLGMANHVAPIAAFAHALSAKPGATALVLRASNHITHSPDLGSSLRRLHLQPFWRRAHHIIAVSRSVADSLVSGLGIPASRITVLPSPILPPDLASRAAGDPGHPWLHSRNPARPVIVGLGRFVHQKGFDVLLNAFALVHRERPCRLLLFGDGPQRGALEARIRQLELEDAVSLPGVTPNPYAVLSRADLFVLPSRWEGLPAVLVEALAFGCPVVAADCPGGVAEVLEGGAGALVPPGDAAALADAMTRTLAQPPDRQTLQQAIRPYHTGPAVTAYETWLMSYLEQRSAPLVALAT